MPSREQTESKKLNFPRVTRIRLHKFTLFSRVTAVDERVEKGVFCLAGANGLGKSTFLAAINFGLTGIVPEADRKYKSRDEYYTRGIEFGREYFRGRIGEKDADKAEISLEVEVGSYRIQMTRGMFEPESLRKFTATDRKTGKAILDTSGDDSALRHKKYTAFIANAIGLDTFEQFVFLQVFVLTFDESRHLVFWDPRVLEQTLFLGFGVDHSTAERAEKLRRDAEKADSRVRNTKWQATKVEQRINEIIQTAKGVAFGENAELYAQHEQLTKSARKLSERIAKAEIDQRDAALRLAELTAQQMTLRGKYSDLYGQRIQSKTHVEFHPLVSSALQSSSCGICGTSSPEVAASIRSRTSRHVCPLCESSVKSTGAKSSDIKELKSVDDELGKNRAELEAVLTNVQRIEAVLEVLRQQMLVATRSLNAFERKHKAILRQATSQDAAGIQGLLSSYNTQVANFLAAKDRALEDRSRCRKELKKLQTVLERRYSEAEDKFVPLFKKLAREFIGRDLDVRLDDTAQGVVTLVLDLEKTSRREEHQLSESQRFFIDIALRMALVQYISAAEGQGVILLDTPEGSLDIAYENRAGRMLAKHVADGFPVIMTANINSSRLIQSMASALGRTDMHVCRMTEWAKLSTVQEQEETLFQEAYGEIEAALGSAKKITKARARR